MVTSGGIGQVLFFFAIGILAVVGGILIVKFRKGLYKRTIDEQRMLVGRSMGSAFERLQSPFWIGVVGVGASILGLVFLVMGAIVAIRLAM